MKHNIRIPPLIKICHQFISYIFIMKNNIIIINFSFSYTQLCANEFNISFSQTSAYYFADFCRNHLLCSSRVVLRKPLFKK